jgi:hypothetical protein
MSDIIHSGADGVVPPAAHIYLSNSISDMEYGVGDEDDVERSVTVRCTSFPNRWHCKQQKPRHVNASHCIASYQTFPDTS